MNNNVEMMLGDVSSRLMGKEMTFREIIENLKKDVLPSEEYALFIKTHEQLIWADMYAIDINQRAFARCWGMNAIAAFVMSEDYDVFLECVRAHEKVHPSELFPLRRLAKLVITQTELTPERMQKAEKERRDYMNHGRNLFQFFMNGDICKFFEHVISLCGHMNLNQLVRSYVYSMYQQPLSIKQISAFHYVASL